MSDEDLVKRLRQHPLRVFGKAARFTGSDVERMTNEVCREAADRIEALAAENAALREALKMADGHMMNATFDLNSGAPKRAALATLKRGLKLVSAALQEPTP